jgi:hypothetical protein
MLIAPKYLGSICKIEPAGSLSLYNIALQVSDKSRFFVPHPCIITAAYKYKKSSSINIYRLIILISIRGNERRNIIALILHGKQLSYLAVQPPYPSTET